MALLKQPLPLNQSAILRHKNGNRVYQISKVDDEPRIHFIIWSAQDSVWCPSAMPLEHWSEYFQREDYEIVNKLEAMILYGAV